MKLQRIERETIINYNQAESSASVYTHNPALIRKLDALVESRSDDCQLLRRLHDGLAAEYRVPKRWIKVNAGNVGRILSDEQRKQAAARLEKARQARKRDLSRG